MRVLAGMFMIGPMGWGAHGAIVAACDAFRSRMSAGDYIGHGAAPCRRGAQIRGVGLRQNATVDDIAGYAAPPSVFLMDSANTSALRVARKVALIILAVIAAAILALALIPDSVWRAGIEKIVSTHTGRKARIEG